MNNSKKSVTAQAKKSKASRSKRAKKPKETIEFVAIPKQDLIWAKKQKPSVMTLWLECWECDPYGSRWMTLNHSLSKAAFFRAKKILSDKGLFIFKSERSIINGRETAYWSVQNLHGARRKNFGFELDNTVDNTVDNTNNTLNTTDVKSDSLQRDSDSPQRDSDSPQRDSESLYRDSIVPETTQNQGFQSPSITPHKHLNNSSKELLMVFNGDEKKEEMEFANRSQVSFGGKIPPNPQNGGYLPPNPQGAEGKGNDLPAQSGILDISDKATNPELTKKSTEEEKSDGYSSDLIKATEPQNLAREDRETSSEGNMSWEEFSSQIRAIFEKKKKEKLERRRANLKGDSPMSLGDRPELS